MDCWRQIKESGAKDYCSTQAEVISSLLLPDQSNTGAEDHVMTLEYSM